MPGSHWDIVLPSAGGAGRRPRRLPAHGPGRSRHHLRPLVAAPGPVTVMSSLLLPALSLAAILAAGGAAATPGTTMRGRPGSSATESWSTSRSSRRTRGARAPRGGGVRRRPFRMTDAASGRPVPGQKPAAWMDMSGVVAGKGGEQRACKDKVALYLQGSVGIRPMVDLNSYYLLVLNQDGSISVIDPVVSMTGNTSLFTTVVLKRPAADWAKSADQKRLYLSLPKAGEIAVVDAETFKVVGGIAAGGEPMRLVLQPDGRRLWVGDDARAPGKGGVSVVDTESADGGGLHPDRLGAPRDRPRRRPAGLRHQPGLGHGHRDRRREAREVAGHRHRADADGGGLVAALPLGLRHRRQDRDDRGDRPGPPGGGRSHRGEARSRADPLHPGREVGLRRQPRRRGPCSSWTPRRTGSSTPSRSRGSPTR